jgi:pilus assembly protein CpaF
MNTQIQQENRKEKQLVVTVAARGKFMMKRAFASGFPVRIGRGTDCHICLPVVSVSRQQAVVMLTEAGIVVRDASSRGTMVNGALLHNAERLVDVPKASLQISGYEVQAELLSRDAGPPNLRRQVHQALIERLDLARYPRSAQVSDALRRDVQQALEQLVVELGVPEHLRGRVRQEVADEALGLGPLEALLKDPLVSEIMVVEPSVIYAERDGRLELTGRSFSDADAVRSAIERIVSPLGRRVDESSPLVDARLPDGSRVNAVIPPLALRGPCITIRKFRTGSLGALDLVSKGSLSEPMSEFLAQAVRARKNVVISGGTGSGKTTLLNILSAHIPSRERILTIEDAAELALKQEHVVSLESRPPNLEGKGEFTIRDLVKNALRMRPDRIVVGECRGGEALDMLQAMNTGHEGSMTTTHANSPREAVSRLETLCLMSGVELPLSAIRRQIASSVHLIVQQSRLADGSRKVTRIAEVVGLDDRGDVEVQDLYQFIEDGTDAAGRICGRFLATGRIPSFIEELQRASGGEGR